MCSASGTQSRKSPNAERPTAADDQADVADAEDGHGRQSPRRAVRAAFAQRESVRDHCVAPMLRVPPARRACELEPDGDDACAPPRSRRARALLAWLAAHPGAHARGELAARFWPDVLDESARASLRVGADRAARARSGRRPAASSRRARPSRSTATRPSGSTCARSTRCSRRAAPREAVDACAGELLTGIDDDWVHDARQEHAQRLGAALERARGRRRARRRPRRGRAPVARARSRSTRSPRSRTDG